MVFHIQHKVKQSSIKRLYLFLYPLVTTSPIEDNISRDSNASTGRKACMCQCLHEVNDPPIDLDAAKVHQISCNFMKENIVTRRAALERSTSLSCVKWSWPQGHLSTISLFQKDKSHHCWSYEPYATLSQPFDSEYKMKRILRITQI